MKYPKGIVTSNEEESEDIIEFSPNKLVSGIKINMNGNYDCFSTTFSNKVLLEVWNCSNNPTPFNNKAFLLNSFYDWIIVRDQDDVLILVPIKKKGE